MDYIKVARDMLDLEYEHDLDSELIKDLHHCDELIGNVGGCLQSRQLVALIVMNWEKNNQ